MERADLITSEFSRTISLERADLITSEFSRTMSLERAYLITSELSMAMSLERADLLRPKVYPHGAALTPLGADKPKCKTAFIITYHPYGRSATRRSATKTSSYQDFQLPRLSATMT